MFYNAEAAASDIDPKWVEDHWAKIPCTELADGNLRTGPVRLSFPWLFDKQPAMEEGKEPKHTATFLFPLGADLSLLKAKASAAALAKWPTPPSSLHTPFRNQADKATLDGYVADGSVFITCSANRKPVVVDARGAPITDKDKLYPGCWVLGIINPFAFDQKVKKGVSFGLEGVIFLADDRKLGGGGGVNVQAATAGLNIDQSVNVAALF